MSVRRPRTFPHPLQSERQTVVAPGLQVRQRAVAQFFRERVPPFDLGQDSFATSTSIGIGIYPDNARDARTLVQAADWGMYASKRAGRGGYTFFEGPALEAA